MKFGVFSDIHSNFEALTAVLDDMTRIGVTHPVCLGDIVGYNANPKECLKVVRELGCPIVKGNHDEMVSATSEAKNYNAMAGEGIAFSREALNEEEKSFLRKIPMKRRVQGYTIVHSSLDDPENWNYISSALEAGNSFIYQFTQLCFIGHTHVAQIFLKEGDVRELNHDRPVELAKSSRYLVNVGSVGQPRDHNWKSSYVVFDINKNTIEFRRVPYDLEKTQKKIIDAGLPHEIAERLQHAV
ncbi:MAG: metallophosphoesterase family protein [Verrucomicrobiota bacterium]